MILFLSKNEAAIFYLNNEAPNFLKKESYVHENLFITDAMRNPIVERLQSSGSIV